MQPVYRIIGAVFMAGAVGFCVMLGGAQVFFDIPSFILVGAIVGGGLMFAYGPLVPIAAMVCAIGASPPPRGLIDRYIAAMSLAGQLAWAAAVIGFLLGMISLMANMADPSSMAGGMSVAFCTVLYGAVCAELVFNPMRHALIARREAEADAADEKPAPRRAAMPPASPVGRVAVLVLMGWAFASLFAAGSQSEQNVRRAQDELFQSIREVLEFDGTSSPATTTIRRLESISKDPPQ